VDLRTINDFVETVDLILSEAEVKDAGGVVEIYLDTGDVCGAALGMYAFYEDGLFKERLFDGDRALVRALAGRGDFGPFHLLGPHQAEFLSLLNDGFGVRHQDVFEYASHFWFDAGITAEATSLHDLTGERLKEVVSRQVGNGANFFKAVESIRGDWRWRLKEWRRTRTFEIKTTPDDFVGHLKSGEFDAIRKRLDKVRPKLTDNNFADAIALVSLMEKVDAFNKAGSKGALPCFYASPHFAGAVKKVGLSDRLMVTLPNQGRVGVLRSSDYFVLRSIFKQSEQLGAKSGVLLTLDKLQTIHAEMREILKVKRVLKNEQWGGVDVPTPDAINALVKEVTELSFFDNVWLPYRGERDAQESLERLAATEYVMSRADLQPTLESEVNKLQAMLKTNADRFETLRVLWKDIPKAFDRQQKVLKPHAETESDLMRRTGLLRFSFPQHARERIFKVIAALVSGQEQRRKDATGTVVRAYLSFSAGNRSTALEAELAAAVLWVAKLDQHILKLLSEPRRAHFSLDLVYAASAVRHGRDIEFALHTYESLEKQLKAETVPSERADLALGLAYLYSHLWHRYRENQHEQRLVRIVLGFESPAEIISTAVRRAEEAYEILAKGNDEVKLVYVLNQCVYFMSIAMTYPVEIVRPLAEKLRDSYEERGLWQYRFDDTLARYYYFRATLATDRKSKEELLILGLERSRKAFKEAPEDTEIQQTLEKLRDESVMLRERRPEPSPAM
jgi:hypothetical protein